MWSVVRNERSHNGHVGVCCCPLCYTEMRVGSVKKNTEVNEMQWKCVYVVKQKRIRARKSGADGLNTTMNY